MFNLEGNTGKILEKYACCFSLLFKVLIHIVSLVLMMSWSRLVSPDYINIFFGIFSFCNPNPNSCINPDVCLI